jgi:hypothetical protein
MSYIAANSIAEGIFSKFPLRLQHSCEGLSAGVQKEKSVRVQKEKLYSE